MHPTWSSHLDHDVSLCVADASANPAKAGSATTMQIELEIELLRQDVTVVILDFFPLRFLDSQLRWLSQNERRVDLQVRVDNNF